MTTLGKRYSNPILPILPHSLPVYMGENTTVKYKQTSQVKNHASKESK